MPLWDRFAYTADINYIIDTHIVEYDIRAANICTLYDAKAISERTFQNLLHTPKDERERIVGHMIRRQAGLYDIIRSGIENAKHYLFDYFNLDESNVLSIRNDAVFVVFQGPVPDIQRVQVTDNVYFKQDGIYRSFYKLMENEWFYSYDPVSGREGIDVKGISQYALQECGLIRYLLDVFNAAIMNGVQVAYDEISDLFKMLVNKELPLDCYRRLDSDSCFDLISDTMYAPFKAEFIDPSNLPYVDVGFNALVLRILMSYYTNEIIHK